VIKDWAPLEPSDIVTVAPSGCESSATMLAASTANATLLGVGGAVDSLLQATSAMLAAVAMSVR
jgi:hypothetical protein